MAVEASGSCLGRGDGAGSGVLVHDSTALGLTQALPLPRMAAQPGAGYTTFLGLGFAISKMGMITEPTSLADLRLNNDTKTLLIRITFMSRVSLGMERR